jgi:hypothetical protein
VSSYNKSCVNGAPVNPHDFCLNLTDGNRYYDECYFCDINEGKVFDYSDYWCEQEWVNFPPLPNPEDLFLEREPQDCSTYTLAANECNPTAGECSYCYGNGLWKYDSCFDGWYMNGKVCTENACEGYNSYSMAIAGCATTSQCQKGATTMYKCSECAAGYKLENGGCIYDCPYTEITKPTGCKTTEYCDRFGITYFDTTCKVCHEGYRLNNGKCEQTCTYLSMSNLNCSNSTSCVRGSDSGNITYYNCTQCREGYYLSPYDTTCIACEEGKLGARTDEPYDDNECKNLAKSNSGKGGDAGSSSGNVDYIAATSECSGKTYYYCAEIEVEDTGDKK